MNIGDLVEIRGDVYLIRDYDITTNVYKLENPAGNPPMIIMEEAELKYHVAKWRAQAQSIGPTTTSSGNDWQTTAAITDYQIQQLYRILNTENHSPPTYGDGPNDDDNMAYKPLNKGDIIEDTKGTRKWLVLGRAKDGSSYDLQFEGNKIKWSHPDYENAMRTKAIKVTRAKEPVKALKLDELDKVVLKPEAREDIIAAIMQAHKKELIFETWGLGETVEYGKGLGLLFYGGPGTGKTWGAHCIAKALGQELMVVTTGQIQSSLAGQTNKNIENAFKAAREGNHILFLDECDSFIADRKHLGMILGSEINTILTCIEKAEGITILATNKIESLDPALERRLALILEFPKPNLEQRRKIWETLIPKKFPLGEDVTLDTLAENKLTGGMIKNVLLAAARLAASGDAKVVTKEHFEKAIARTKASENKMGTRGAQGGGVVDYVMNGDAGGV